MVEWDFLKFNISFYIQITITPPLKLANKYDPLKVSSFSIIHLTIDKKCNILECQLKKQFIGYTKKTPDLTLFPK